MAANGSRGSLWGDYGDNCKSVDILKATELTVHFKYCIVSNVNYISRKLLKKKKKYGLISLETTPLF